MASERGQGGGVPSSMALDDGATLLNLVLTEPEVLVVVGHHGAPGRSVLPTYTQWISVRSEMPAPASHPAARSLICAGARRRHSRFMEHRRGWRRGEARPWRGEEAAGQEMECAGGLEWRRRAKERMRRGEQAAGKAKCLSVR